MTVPANDGLLAPSDIADLVGVSRAAVSNWRKRMDDFPMPSGGTDNKPLFSTSDVESWLAKHPEKSKSAQGRSTAPREWEKRLWGIANLLRGRMSIIEISNLFVQTAVAVVEKEQPRTSVCAPFNEADGLRAVIESIPRDELADAIDDVLERVSRAQGKSAGDTGSVGSRISSLLALLGSSLSGGTIYDPACGIGVALVKAVMMGARPDCIVGEDINPDVLEIAHGRAILRGLDISLRNVDVLEVDADSKLRADVILAEIPFESRVPDQTAIYDPRLAFGLPSRRRADTFWLQHVISHLGPDGIGYVVTSRSSLSQGGRDVQIRKALLQAGCVRAVVALPGKMLPYTSLPLALWVLDDGTSIKDGVLLIDASNVAEPEHLIAGWLINERLLSTVPHARVPSGDLAVGDVNLNPPKWIAIEEIDNTNLGKDFEAARTRLIEASKALPAVVKHISAIDAVTAPPIMTVGKLIEAGAVDLVAGRAVREIDTSEVGDRLVDAARVRSGDIAKARGIIPAHQRLPLTEPGDVFITVMHNVHATVDESGGHMPVNGVYRLRIHDREKLDPYYLADALTGDWNLRLGTGGAISRIPIRELEFPLLPLDEQQGLHREIAKARHAKALALEVSDAADTVANTILTAARYGVMSSVAQAE